VFPTAIRASGAGVAVAIAKAGAVFGTFVLPILNRWMGTAPLLFMLALTCVAAAGFTYLFRVETTGRSLEQVDTSPDLFSRVRTSFS
jgi:hypothetical protein